MLLSCSGRGGCSDIQPFPLFPICSEYPDVSPTLQDILLVQYEIDYAALYLLFLLSSFYRPGGLLLSFCRLVRNLFDSSRVSSMLLVITSSRNANSLSEYEDKSLSIFSWKGVKIASIFLSNFLFRTGSTMVRRLSFGSFTLLTYPASSNRSMMPVTAAVVKPVSSASLPAGMAP